MMNMFRMNLGQATKVGSLFPPSEEEVIGVEHLLLEPKYDLDDDVLGFGSFSQNTCFKIDEFSTVKYCFSNTQEDAKDSSFDPVGKTNGEFPVGVFGRPDATVPRRKNSISDVCEDYLLDIEFADEVCDLNSLQGPYKEDLGVKSKSLVPGAEMPALTAERTPVVEKMTIPFANKFECETSVTDKQSLEHHLSTGSEDFVEPSDQNGGQTVSPMTDQCLKLGSSDPADIFHNVRRKPRLQHGKRQKHNDIVSFKALSSEVRGKKDLLAARKRPRRPTRRYIEESMEQNTKYQKKRCMVSGTCSKDKVPLKGSHWQQRQKRSNAKRSSISQKEPFEGACIQVPFGQPVDIEPLKKKKLEAEYVDDSELLTSSSSSSSDSDSESVSIESQDDLSENDCSRGYKTKKYNGPRKHHIYWSLSEVLKLVEGVTMYGVGRWTEIKRLHFHSSENRTSVDLKDKWRNLLRASCSLSQSNSEVGTRKKHPSQSIPQSVLHQVRQLAAVYPYPRARKTRGSVASPVPGTTEARNSLIHLPAAVSV